MKKLLGMIAVVLAIATSAFTVNYNTKLVTGKSYVYDLYGQSGQDLVENINNPENYSYDSMDPLDCSGSLHICGVENATDDGFGKPDFTKTYDVIKRD